MTLFTYIVAESKKKNFKEPELLAQLLHRLVPETGKKGSQVGGWSMHYTMGTIFSILYVELWDRKIVKPNFRNGLLLGGFGGITGILVWKLAFSLHPNPPQIHFKKYYGHLLLAHLVFAVFATVGYTLVSADADKPELQKNVKDSHRSKQLKS